MALVFHFFAGGILPSKGFNLCDYFAADFCLLGASEESVRFFLGAFDCTSSLSSTGFPLHITF